MLNRGYDAKRQAWKEAEGKAWFVEGVDKGHLKVSFFGPFYGGYNVLVVMAGSCGQGLGPGG